MGLTVFGVSVVIGAGIFTITASTAGGITGPAIAISFVIAAIACGLAALCYAEFASTVPVAGSAYTFSYATFGEFIAWIIGWDLILEFAVAAAVVAKGWSSYLGTVFGFGGGTTELAGHQLDWGALLIIAFVTDDPGVGHQAVGEVSLVITVIKVRSCCLSSPSGRSTSSRPTTRRSSRRASPAAVRVQSSRCCR